MTGQQYRGAPMGRPNRPLEWGDKLRLSVLKIDSQGYDPGGAYWGVGMPLYQARDDHGGVFHFRAPDREAAKVELAGFAPAGAKLRFYR